jgi:hypothetical protein
LGQAAVTSLEVNTAPAPAAIAEAAAIVPVDLERNSRRVTPFSISSFGELTGGFFLISSLISFSYC